jgi:HlyD family secretion protein
MKTGKKTAIIVSAVAVTALLCFVFLRKKEVPVELQTEKPHYGYISESVTATGTVQPVDTVAVGTQISGTIYKIYTDFNSNVKQGELLAELDPSLTKAALLEARANLAEAESNEAYQEKNYNRQNQLYAAGAISKADYDLALNSLNTTKASIRNAEGQVNAALKNLSFTKIYSPINGVVLNRNVSVGQTVAASFSTPTLFSIAKDITHMQVRANVDEADIGNVKKGSRATFTVDAYQDNVFKGNVTEVRLQPTVSANVVTYTTLINAENPDKKLKPGMTANVTIYTRESDSTLLIPVKATRFKPDSVDMKKYKIEPLPRTRDQQINVRNKDSATAANYDRAYVWLLQEDKIVQRKIKTGLNNSINVQVLAGLTPSDLVLTGTADHEPGKASVNGASPFMPARRSPSRGGPGR